MDGHALVDLARRSITAVLEGRNVPVAKISEKKGCFVTLHKNGNLRGCIGYVTTNKPLGNLIPHAAVAAALHDPRFPPLSAEELPEVQIEVSLLSPPHHLHTKAELHEITPGEHGLIITRGAASGLLLPQVFTEHDRIDDMLRMTCEKAGLPKNAWHQRGTDIYTFTVDAYTE